VRTSEELERALGEVIEPALGRSLRDLGLLSNVEKGLLGVARAHVSVPFPNYPFADELLQNLKRSLAAAKKTSIQAQLDQ